MKRYLDFRRLPDRKVRAPLISFKELADAAGMPLGRFGAFWATHPDGRPEPALQHLRGSGRWYHRREALNFILKLKDRPL